MKKMTLSQAIEVLTHNTTLERFITIVKELGYASQGWNPLIFRDAAEVVLPMLIEIRDLHIEPVDGGYIATPEGVSCYFEHFADAVEWVCERKEIKHGNMQSPQT